jgi:hypothetical protein
LWWEGRLSEGERGQFYRLLLEQPALAGEAFVALGWSERDLYKHTMLEQLPFDVDVFMRDGAIVRSRSTLLVVNYADANAKQPSLFTVSLEL